MGYNGNVFITQGASHALGTIIDGYLSANETELLLSIWKKEWTEPLAFSGGEKAITCEMILEVPETEFIQAFGTKKANKELAARILATAKNNAGR